MKYLELIKENNEELMERYEVVTERVAEISANAKETGIYADYFEKTAQYLMLLNKIVNHALHDEIRGMEEEQAVEINAQLFADIKGEAYETSYANPTYAVAQFGKEAGQMLSMLLADIHIFKKHAFEGNLQGVCIYSELFVEIYSYFCEEEVELNLVKDAIYSFMHDYSEVFNENYVCRLVNPDYDYYTDIVMEADLTNTAYLYRYGMHVSDNEIGISKFLNTFSEKEIQAMADTYTEGYRMGFEATQKDLSIKTTVEVRYPIGFERMVRAAVKNFEKLNLRCVLRPFTTSENKQYDYDHKEDTALWMNKAYVERSLEVYRTVFEKYKEMAAGYAGPAVIEVFGEEPFSPESKEANLKLDEKQQKLSIYNRSEFGQIMNRYIKGEERSFTIIAYPIPEIGEKFEEIFAETVKLNTLDYVLYRDMQQKIIDVLDQAEKVHIVGTRGNKTDLYVSIYPLQNPEKETAFENCVADVNIPVGEVFTSPVLKGTTGKLHVSQVYLREYNFLNLEIDFVDGMIDKYTCTNFETEEENKKYVQENILYRHETLPLGEFAIGTNTTAYKMAREYDIAAKLPILIAEKTGPHFAVGDTCYTYDEDNITYNPDGKAIVARDNEVSILRKTDMSKAYFNCHTDITIPYDELGRITVIKRDGSTEDIIVDGRFVVPGTDLLNKPLDEM
ncbi:MAG: aminopeptidase [Agathobacter sp.]|nr:aminopeptidase [Agathobacter sp.]